MLLHQEYEIDKTLGITGPEDVAKMGVAVYNNECRKIVMRYSGEWEVSYHVFHCPPCVYKSTNIFSENCQSPWALDRF